MMAGYAHPEVLVEPDWLDAHLNDRQVRIVEANEDPALYDQGHIPGAVRLHWKQDLQDPIVRDWVPKDRFEHILGELGVEHSQTDVFYFDSNNILTSHICLSMNLYRNLDARIFNGGLDVFLSRRQKSSRQVLCFAPTL